MMSSSQLNNIKENIPYDLLRLGTACNVKCAFCNIPSEDRAYPELKPHEAEMQLQEFLKKNGKDTRVSISGGEPTIYKDLPVIIRYAKKIGIKILELQTNAILFDNIDYAKTISDAGLDKAFISLHSYIPETHDILVGKRGAFGRCISGIKNLINEGIEVTLNPVLTTLNYRDVVKLFKFVHSDFPLIRYISLSVVQPKGRAWQNLELLPKYSKLSPYVAEALEYANLNGMVINNPYCGLPLCIGNWSKYMEQTVEYSINKLDNNNLRKDSNKTQGSKCVECKLKKACNGVWNEYASTYGFNELKPQ